MHFPRRLLVGAAALAILPLAALIRPPDAASGMSLARLSSSPVRIAPAEPVHTAPAEFSLLGSRTHVLSHVIVTALTCMGRGTCVAGGRYIVPQTDQLASSPYYEAGSVFLRTADDGAHWATHVSTTNPQAVILGVEAKPWANHATPPLDFTALSIAVDPTNPSIIYEAGGSCSVICQVPLQGYSVIRSSNGGQTWENALVYKQPLQSVATAATIQTNVVKTGAFVTAILSHGPPLEASGLAFDPRNHRHVFVCASGLGVLSTTNDARTWTYVTQPGQQRTPCEVVFDPRNSRTMYRLDRLGFLYRSTDGGAHWVLRAVLGGPSMGANSTLTTSLTAIGATLYVVTMRGLQESSDGGAHFYIVRGAPGQGGFLLAAIRGVGGWVAALAAPATASPEGVYLARDGGPWQLGAANDRFGSGGYSALDLQSIYGSLMSRMWEDHTTRVVFTTGASGGFYRWSSSL